ncbi:MAG: ribbon-helix-helix domain-containing protein [Psychrobacillus psychrodurans]
MAVDKSKHTQVLVTFPIKLMQEIETYWHENKLPNRNAAIRELIKKGLEKELTE